jgi:hypothetical protein
MNKWILGIGTFLIGAIFFIFFLQLQKSRLTSTTQVVGQPLTSHVNVPQADLDPMVAREAQQEAQIHQILRRGTLISVDPTTQTMSILNYDPRGLENENLFDVSYRDVNQALCWPGTRQAGDITIDMKDSFIQLNTNGNLNLNNETLISNPSFTKYTSKFIFIKLQDQMSNQVLQAEQIAVLDC